MQAREGQVVIADSNGKPVFGASYSVQALPVGAQCSQTVTANTTIPVYAGHGFSAGQKMMVGTDETTYRTVSTANTLSLVVNSAVTCYRGDVIVNLGADAGATSPNYDDSTIPTYVDMGLSVVNTSSTVVTDTAGNFTYYSAAPEFWELWRDATNVPIRVVQDVRTLPVSLVVTDGVTIPTTAFGRVFLYVDTADGDLKVKFGDGFVRVVAADT